MIHDRISPTEMNWNEEEICEAIFAHPAIVGFHTTLKNKLYMHE